MTPRLGKASSLSRFAYHIEFTSPMPRSRLIERRRFRTLIGYYGIGVPVPARSKIDEKQFSRPLKYRRTGRREFAQPDDSSLLLSTLSKRKGKWEINLSLK